MTSDPCELDRDHTCLRCGYNLRGLDAASNCPECGLEIERSLRGGRLEFSQPAYLQRLRRGADLILTSFILFLPAALALAFLSFSTPRGYSGGLTVTAYALLLAALVALVAPALLLVGWWLLTTPDEERRGVEARFSSRRIARLLTPTLAAAYLALLALIVLRQSAADIAAALGWRRVTAALIVLALVHILASARYLQTLASRIEGEAMAMSAVGLWIAGGVTVASVVLAAWAWPLLAIFAPVALIGVIICLCLYATALSRFAAALREVLHRGGDAGGAAP